MLLLLGMFYLSVGCFASVLTKNQIVAAIISFCVITLLFFLGLVSFILLDISSTTRQLLGYFSAIEQMGTLSRGEIDTRPMVLYLSMTDRDADPHLPGVSIAEMETVRRWLTKLLRQHKPKKIHRVQIGLNVLIQIALILFLAAMVNYLGFEHYRRWDLSRDKKYALSDKTKRFLESMKGKVRITVFFGPNNPIAGDVQNLLTEYQYAGKGKIDVENVDPERNLSRAKELFDKYKVVSEESLLILDYQGRNKTVKASEMAEIDQGNPMFGEEPRSPPSRANRRSRAR